jgi:divalent metal cation (Fe/Co/Zn/Cd) transporter
LTGIVLYLTTGSSQTMKTAWVTDFLSIVPSMALFGALRRELQPPDERYPFGHFRADGNALVARIESARQDLTTLDWRLHSITVMPVA